MNGMSSHPRKRDLLFLFGCYALYSVSGIFGKLAAGHEIFSFRFLFFYGCEVCVLGVYAILWQRILKRFELNRAYAGRPLVTVLNMVWAVVLFHERFTLRMLIGTCVILIGIYLAVTTPKGASTDE